MGNDDCPLRLSSGSPHRHGEASPMSTPTAQHMIGTERLRTRKNDVLAGWSSTFNTVQGKHCRFIYIFQHNHYTTGLCVTFRVVVHWKLRQLNPTAQSTTKSRNRPMIDASNRMSGCLGEAQGMACFGFCLLSSVFYLFFVRFSMA